MQKRKMCPNEIERLYRSGFSIRQVAAKLGGSFQRVQAVLVERGVQRRAKHVTSRAKNYTGKSFSSRRESAGGTGTKTRDLGTSKNLPAIPAT